MSDSVKVIPENAPASKPREKRVRVEQVLADEAAFAAQPSGWACCKESRVRSCCAE
jgi:hypothetical protein